MTRLRHPLVLVFGATLLTVPWLGPLVYNFLLTWSATADLVVAVLGPGVGQFHYATGPEVAVSGLAVLGASFLLAWGAETAEKDVPTAFAIAVLAVLAVAPEYAVDALYAWNAGAFAGTPRGAEAANLAVANMTGANRILIGLGWSGIALYTVYRALQRDDPAVRDRPGVLADAVQIDRDIATEITFLFLATLWAFLVPLNGGIDALDTVVLVGLYAVYIVIVIRGDVEPTEEHGGVPEYFQGWRQPWRAVVVLALFAFSGLAIFTAVEPFAHGLEAIGVAAGIPPFFMIQWIAPLASEAPELIVVIVLVNKARSTAGFNALISSKLNQWTLLIGTLAVVYSIALGQYGTLPFDFKQAAEIWLTAAQSLFAIAILVNFEIKVREALVLLVLFLSQVVIEFLILRVLAVANPEQLSVAFLLGYTVVYVLIALALFVKRRRRLAEVVRLAADAARTAAGRQPRLDRAD